MIYRNSEALLRTSALLRPASCIPQGAQRGASTRPRAYGGRSRRSALFAASLLVWAAALSPASAQTNYSVDDAIPEMDKWMYPFATGGNGGGTRSPASTFGAIGETDFDERDAQFFTQFATSGTVPAGRGPENYLVQSATFTLRIARQEIGGEPGPGFIYDGTYDSITTYGIGGAPLNDLDPGRPLELYGAGYRNGLTVGTVLEGTPFTSSSAPSPAKNLRNIYATDFHLASSINGSPRDVSNNVSEGFEAVPFAIGQISEDDLDDEGKPLDDALVTFTLNLANPDVVRYLQFSLDEGRLAFVATSLHLAAQGGPSVYPAYYTDDAILGDPGHLQMQVQVVPEPSAVTLALCGFGLFVACWRGRRVITNQEEIV